MFGYTLKDVPITGEFGKKLYKASENKDIDESNPKWITWDKLMEYNLYWHCRNKSSDDLVSAAELNSISEENAMKMYAVFQSLRNPYTNTNIVLATRKGYDKFVQNLSSWAGSSGYHFMLGLPACHTGKSKNKGMFVGWRQKYANVKESFAADEFRNYLLNDVIKSNVFEDDIVEFPDDGFAQIWNYATGKDSGFDDITDEGKVWIDKHLCPYYLWGSKERKESGKFCKYTCTEESIEHFAIVSELNGGTNQPQISKQGYALLLEYLFSSLSV